MYLPFSVVCVLFFSVEYGSFVFYNNYERYKCVTHTHTNTHIHTHRQPVEKKCKNRETIMPKQFLKPSINKWHTQNDSNRCQLLILNVTHGLCSIIRWKRTKKNENHNDVAHLLSLHQFKPFSFDA